MAFFRSYTVKTIQSMFDDLDEMQVLHDQDTLAMKQSLIELALSNVTKAAAKLDAEEASLLAQRDDLKLDLERQEQKREVLESEKATLQIPADDDVFRSGDYFRRLNALEVSEAQFRGELAGRKTALRLISDEVKSQEARNHRLQRQLNKLLAQLPDGGLAPEDSRDGDIRVAALRRRFSGGGEVRRLQKRLRQYEAEIEDAREECEELREMVREKSARLQATPKDTLDGMIAQRREIEAEIELKKEQLRQVRAEEKKERAKESLNMDRDRKRAEEIEKEDVWESERRTLMAAITHARTEIRALKEEFDRDEATSRASSSLSDARRNARRRERDVEGSVSSRAPSGMSMLSSVSKRDEQVKYSENALRMAMRAELDALKTPDHPIMIALEAERLFGEKLDRELKEIEATTNQITVFEEETYGKFNDDEADPDDEMRQQRLEVLRSEYEELRNELRNFKA